MKAQCSTRVLRIWKLTKLPARQFTEEAVLEILGDCYSDEWDGEGYYQSFNAYEAADRLVLLHEQSED